MASRQLLATLTHATRMAAEDPDLTARPLWAQIAGEIDAFLSTTEPDDQALTGPLDRPLFSHAGIPAGDVTPTT